MDFGDNPENPNNLMDQARLIVENLILAVLEPDNKKRLLLFADIRMDPNLDVMVQTEFDSAEEQVRARDLTALPEGITLAIVRKARALWQPSLKKSHNVPAIVNSLILAILDPDNGQSFEVLSINHNPKLDGMVHRRFASLRKKVRSGNMRGLSKGTTLSIILSAETLWEASGIPVPTGKQTLEVFKTLGLEPS